MALRYRGINQHKYSKFSRILIAFSATRLLSLALNTLTAAPSREATGEAVKGRALVVVVIVVFAVVVIVSVPFALFLIVHVLVLIIVVVIRWSS